MSSYQHLRLDWQRASEPTPLVVAHPGQEGASVSVAPGVALLTLNRPDRLNSFNDAMHGELQTALADLAQGVAAGELRALVLTGAGRGFCAGQDLNDRNVAPGGAPLDLGATIERFYRPLVLGLRGLEVPVLAAVNGVAAGAGANIALACDLVYGARSASFIQAFSKIGLVPDSGGTWFLPRLIGPARALGLALTGEKLPAEKAEAWGMIWKCVDDNALLTTVLADAAALAAGPTRGYARTKAAIHGSGQLSLEAALDVERDYQRELGRSADYQEGVAAFMGKRAPVFRGR